MENYDAIFIGSGIGSLTTASLLAQFKGQKVLILEQHFKAGGFTHIFKRKKGSYAWDVGIHYIGDLHEGSLVRKVFDTITQKNLKWEKMKEPFERFVYPEGTFAVHGDPKKYLADLIEQFPEEEQAIRKYFKDIRKASVYFGKHMMLKMAPPALESLINLFGDDKPIETLADYLDHNFKDHRLKAILASQWGDYGLTPSKAAFVIHAMVAQHYLNGGYYPIGGSDKIFETIKPIIEEKGGVVLTSHLVKEVIIENNKVVGVKVEPLKGENKGQIVEYRAPVVVSDAGSYTTYTRLIPESYPIKFREDLKEFFTSQPAISNVTAYIGLKESPEKLGFKGENYWIYNSYDHDENFAKRNEWLKEGEELGGAYLSFPSLKDPEAKGHTADIIAFTDYEYFEKWKDEPWKKRGEEYEQFKQKIADKMIEFVEKRFPGFKELVDYVEVSTPLTNEFFTTHAKGTIYGLPCVPERFDREKCGWFEIKTPIEGLYLTGADVSSPGVSGAMMGGLNVALLLMNGIDVIKLISRGVQN